MSDSTKQLVISATLAAVGFAIGGPTGAQIGWTLGAAASAPTQRSQGPQLGEPVLHGAAWQDDDTPESAR